MRIPNSKTRRKRVKCHGNRFTSTSNTSEEEVPQCSSTKKVRSDTTVTVDAANTSTRRSDTTVTVDAANTSTRRSDTTVTVDAANTSTLLTLAHGRSDTTVTVDAANTSTLIQR